MNKIIKSKTLGRTLDFTTFGRYILLNGVQITDKDGYALTADADGNFTKVVKKYYTNLLREHHKRN